MFSKILFLGMGILASIGTGSTVSDSISSLDSTVETQSSISSNSEETETTMEESNTVEESINDIKNKTIQTVEVDGVVYETNLTTLTAKAIQLTTEMTGVVLPENITDGGTTFVVNAIGENAFFNDKLSSIKLPDSILTIEKGAFSNNKLTEIVIPASVKQIGTNFLAGNELLQKVEFKGELPEGEGYWFSEEGMSNHKSPISINYTGSVESAKEISNYLVNGEQAYLLPIGKETDDMAGYGFTNDEFTVASGGSISLPIVEQMYRYNIKTTDIKNTWINKDDLSWEKQNNNGQWEPVQQGALLLLRNITSENAGIYRGKGILPNNTVYELRDFKINVNEMLNANIFVDNDHNVETTQDQTKLESFSAASEGELYQNVIDFLTKNIDKNYVVVSIKNNGNELSVFVSETGEIKETSSLDATTKQINIDSYKLISGAIETTTRFDISNPPTNELWVDENNKRYLGNETITTTFTSDKDDVESTIFQGLNLNSKKKAGEIIPVDVNEKQIGGILQGITTETSIEGDIVTLPEIIKGYNGVSYYIDKTQDVDTNLAEVQIVLSSKDQQIKYEIDQDEANKMINVTIPTKMLFNVENAQDKKVKSEKYKIVNNSKDMDIKVSVDTDSFHVKNNGGISLLEKGDPVPTTIEEKLALNMEVGKSTFLLANNSESGSFEVQKDDEIPLNFSGQYYGEITRYKKNIFADLTLTITAE